MVDFLGREHFIEFAEQSSGLYTLAKARNTFTELTVRRAYPNDTRHDEFERYGLVIVTRDVAGLGEIPDCARYNTPTSGAAVQCGRYAIGLESLEQFARSILEHELSPPKKINVKTAEFLGELTAANRS